MGGVVRRHIDFLTLLIPIYNYILLVFVFLQQHPYFLILKMFFILVYVIFVQRYSN